MQTHDEILPGAKQLQALTDVIKKEKPACVLARKGNTSNALQRWANQWQLRVVEVDLLGVDPAIHSYADLMQSVGDALVSCFKTN